MTGRQPWVRVSDLSDRFGIRNPEEPDLIAMRKACEAGCSWVELELGRQILRSHYVRRFDGSGKTYQHLPFPPIRLVNSLFVNGKQVQVATADEAATNGNIAYFDEEKLMLNGSPGGPPGFTMGWFASNGFPKGSKNIRVDWESGWSREEIPSVIMAFTEVVCGIFFKEKHRMGDQGRSAGRGGSTQYLRELVGNDLKAVKKLTDWRMMYIDRGVPLDGDSGSQLGSFTLGASDLG